MSIKENVEMLKEEISNEEKLLEGMIKAESFFKKYKKLLIGAAVALILLAVGYSIQNYLEQKNLEASNKALLTLEQNPSSSDALSILKSKNPKLYEAYQFATHAKSLELDKLTQLKDSITDPYLNDLLDYQIASLSKDKISSYASKDGAILKDLAILEEAFLLLEQNKIKEARVKLDSIAQNPALKGIVQNLKHYMGN